MKRISRTEVSWRFTPPDFFEEPVSFGVGLGTLQVDRGIATLTVPHSAGADARLLLDSAVAAARTVFDARSVMLGRPYKLTHDGFVEVDEDGKQHYTIFPKSACHVVRTSAVDLVVTDPSGSVTVDTRAERIRDDNSYIESLSKKLAQSPLLRRMIESFTRSLDDPDNSLVHLYEVRDAAAHVFGSKAASVLGVSRSDWSTLGRLANDEPIRQGRHRGRTSGRLRDATAAEIEECRGIAKKIINATAATLP